MKKVKVEPGKKAETLQEVAETTVEEPKDTKNKVVRSKKAKSPKKAKAPKPPKQKKEKRSARKQRIAYEKALKKTSAEKTLSLIAIGLALVGTIFQALLDNKKDQD